jgi:predicted MFS family arabinose efflux permease
VTSLAAGRIADMIGRRMTLFWGAAIFVVGGAVQTGTTGYGVMVLGRVVSGAGVGLLSYAYDYFSILIRRVLMF